ncbi:MAG: hypothetical protein K2M02_03655 [Duncaniella sp.]|nr:hypothetical protein [Duncaniella sp.]MDE6495606.1 hypothetical protein [Duncaniella sp.]
MQAGDWQNVGEVIWVDGLFANRSEWKLPIQQSLDDKTCFRFQPYKDYTPNADWDKSDVYVYMHIVDGGKVYLESFEYVWYNFVGYSSYVVTQKCRENSVYEDKYGYICGNVVNFDQDAFQITNVGNLKSQVNMLSVKFPDGILDDLVDTEWVSIGYGLWNDWLESTQPLTAKTDWRVEYFMHPTHPDLICAAPYVSSGAIAYWGGVVSDNSVLIHLNRDNGSAWVEEFELENIVGSPLISHICKENGWNSQSWSYGVIDDDTVFFPENSFAGLFDGDESYSLFTGSMTLRLPSENGSHGVFLGIMAFNGNIEELSIGALDNESEHVYKSFIENLNPKIGTLLYYTVDKAIDKMTEFKFPTNLSNAVLITFTDGLDQGSLAYSPEHRTSENYAAYLSHKISSTYVQGLELTSYCIGLKGEDVMDDELFHANLTSLATAPENAMTVSGMSGVRDRLGEVVKDLTKTSTSRILTISVPQLSDGARIRFTLDGTSGNPELSERWIEGCYSIDTNTFSDVEYYGLTSSSGNEVKAERDGIFLKFTFLDCRDSNGNLLDVIPDDIDQWSFVKSSGKWQHNVEINRDEQIKIEETHSSVGLMFAVDCSSSLGDKFPELQAAVISFVDSLLNGGDMSASPEVLIDNPSVVDETPVYYNLQGIRILEPHGGIFIEVLGDKRTKRYIP